MAVILLDAANAPIAVETNNGQPPSCGDLFFVTSSTSGGHPQPGDQAQENAVLQLPSSPAGTWRPGWNPLP